MTINDPGAPRVTEIKRTYGAEPETTVVHTTEVRESSAAWWIGAIVAIVAILAVVYLVTRSPTDDSAQIAADALEQGRLQGQLESTQSTLAAQESANVAAQSANMATQRAAESAAADARAASNAASDAAARAANRVDTTTIILPAEPVG